MRPVLPVFDGSLLLATPAHAQGESNNWYFGNFCALNFTTGQPSRMLNNAPASNAG